MKKHRNGAPCRQRVVIFAPGCFHGRN
jgi:hypothetical protein